MENTLSCCKQRSADLFFRSAVLHPIMTKSEQRSADLFFGSAVLPAVITKSRGPSEQVRATKLGVRWQQPPPSARGSYGNNDPDARTRKDGNSHCYHLSCSGHRAIVVWSKGGSEQRSADLFFRSAVLPPSTTKSRGPSEQVRATKLNVSVILESIYEPGSTERYHMRKGLILMCLAMVLLPLGVAMPAQAPATSGAPENVYRGELVTYPGPWAFEIPQSGIILVRDDELETLASDSNKPINISTDRQPQNQSLRQICERAQERGERTLTLAFDHFFAQYRPGQDTPRRLMPDTDEYIRKMAAISRFASGYGLGLQLS